MSREEEILHQSIAVKWHNTHVNNKEVFQRLICQWNNAPTKQYGNKMKSMGVKPGVADWQYLIQGGSIWIELKTITGSQSQDQKDFEQLCISLGHQYVIVRDITSMWDIINPHLTKENRIK